MFEKVKIMFHTMGNSILYNKPFVKYKLENLRSKLTSINWTKETVYVSIQFNTKYARTRLQFLMIYIVVSDCLVDKSIGEDEQDER